MNKNIVRITENQLKRIVKESVKKILNEVYGEYLGDGINTHRDWWEGLSDEEIEDIDRKRGNRSSWEKIDNAYKYHIDADKGRNLDNDSLYDASSYFPKGELGMMALGDYGDEWEKFAKSFNGTAVKAPPLKIDIKIEECGKMTPILMFQII